MPRARRHDKVGSSPKSTLTFASPAEAAGHVVRALAFIEGRWKLEILFCLFGGQVRRFSDLERALPGVSQKMLAQQLRRMERDGLVRRVVHPEVPPRVRVQPDRLGSGALPLARRSASVVGGPASWLSSRMISSSISEPARRTSGLAVGAEAFCQVLDGMVFG
jgi:DNA-binding HxlR family transcriptional regulator